MDSPLLVNKLRIPPATGQLVDRPRLVDALERGVSNHKLVLVAAAAGYGKSTLLAQWARASSFPVAWLSAGTEHNDPERFFRSLLGAWEMVRPGIGDGRLGLLLEAASPDVNAVATAFVDAASDALKRTVVVIDDVHVIADPAVNEAMAFLLDNLPPTLRFVLAGRADPLLPLARLRAHGDLLELRAEDLRFSVDEADAFLNGRMDLALTRDEVAPLHEHLEGWVAGLHLVSLTLRRRADKTDALAITGRHRFIADYLTDDVLSHLPKEVRLFLLRTSILDRLCGPLCDAVTGTRGAENALAELERENLFLVPLDDERVWFRYQRLFADVLQDELRRRLPEEVAALHRRAAQWLLAHDLAEPAFRHAIAGEHLDLVVRVFDRRLNVMLAGGEFRLLADWLEALPASWRAADPIFGFAQAGLLVLTGALDAGIRCIDEVEQRLISDAGSPSWQMARVTAFRCFVACFRNDLPLAEQHAAEALRHLRDDDLSFRADIHHALGDTYRANARWDEARTCYLEVLGFADAPAYRLLAAHVYGALADLALRRGRLRQANEYWEQAMASTRERVNWGRLPLPVIGWIHLRLGELLYERNDIAAARDHMTRGLERAELGGDPRALIAGNVVMARLMLMDGDLAGAAACLKRARPLVERVPYPEWSSRFERCRVDLWLGQGRWELAVEWARAELRREPPGQVPDAEPAQLAIARALIAGRDRTAIARATTLLDGLLLEAEAEGRTGVQIEALLLLALASWQHGDRARSMTSLERGLRLAEPEGYVRLVADLGPPIVPLLRDARARGVMPGYVDALLAACAGTLPTSAARHGALPEPLSEREREVLGLIAAGLTNREIAEALSIAPGTVKKHAANIYAKLGVGRRTEAVAKARALDGLA